MSRKKKGSGDVVLSVTVSGGREQVQLTFRNGVEDKITRNRRISFRIYESRLVIYESPTGKGYAISRCHQTKVQREEMVKWAKGREGIYPLLKDECMGIYYIETSPETSNGIEIDSDTPEKRKRSTTAPEEKVQREAEGRTQGCKGCKQPRLNLALTSGNWAFLQRFKGIANKTATDFINEIIEIYQTEHAEELAKMAKKYAEELMEAARKE